MDSMHHPTDKTPQRVDQVPDRADDVIALGEWLTRVAPALGRMPQHQRRAFLKACDALAADLRAINLEVRR